MAVVWATKQNFTPQTAINDTVEEFLEAVDMSAALQAHVQLGIDNESGSVTNGIRINVYTTLDATTEDWDEIPFMSFSVTPTAVTEQDISFVVSGVVKFRIGLLALGATDDYTVGGSYRLRTN